NVDGVIGNALDDLVESPSHFGRTIGEFDDGQSGLLLTDVYEVSAEGVDDALDVPFRHAGVSDGVESFTFRVVQRQSCDVGHVPAPRDDLFGLSVNDDLLHRDGDSVEPDTDALRVVRDHQKLGEYDLDLEATLEVEVPNAMASSHEAGARVRESANTLGRGRGLAGRPLLKEMRHGLRGSREPAVADNACTKCDGVDG